MSFQNSAPFPDFRSRAFLLDHIERTMAFYHPRAIDPRGGFYHFFKDDGTVYDAHTRHLVSSARFVFNYAMAYRQFGQPGYLDAVKHGGGLVWEHYRADWSVDWDYNREDKTNIFRPWGYQPGHLAEWAKLLLILERHSAQLAGDAQRLRPRAVELFDAALERAWDDEFGGIYYGFAPDASICDSDKYFWVQAESLAAAALLAERTGVEKYWTCYRRIWEYCWRHFVDHRYGAWYRLLNRENRKYSDEKSPAGKTDYHTMGACYEVLNVVGR